MFTERDFHRADWTLIQNGPICLFLKPEVLDETKKDLKKLSYKIFEIDCAKGRLEFEMQVSQTLRWSEQFGYEPWNGNTNALHDGFTSFPLFCEKYSVIIFDNFQSVRKLYSKDFEKYVLDSATEAARHALLLGKVLIILLRVNDPRFTSPLVGATRLHWNPKEWLNSARGV